MDPTSTYNYLRNKFVPAKSAYKIIREFDLKFKYGPFSPREIKLAREAIDEFLSERKLTMDDVQSYLAEDAPFPFLELVAHVVTHIEHRTYKAVHTHVAFHYHPLVTHKFGPEEDLELLKLVQKRGFQWKEIARQLEKYRNHCRIRFLQLKGEMSRYITVRQIRTLLAEGLPTTSSGWAEKAKELGVSRDTLVRKVTRYLRSMSFDRSEESYAAIMLFVYALAYNYFSAMSIDIKGLLGFLRGGAPNEGQDLLAVHTEAVPPAPRIESREDFESAFARYFRREDLDLSIKIETDDIFWDTIGRELIITTSTLKVRFAVLRKSYSLVTFHDIYETLKELSWSYYLDGAKMRLLRDSPGAPAQPSPTGVTA